MSNKFFTNTLHYLFSHLTSNTSPLFCCSTRFLNGIYPLQIGGAKNYTSGGNLIVFESLKECVRNIIDNSIMYDLKSPLMQFKSGVGCPAHDTLCPSCGNGNCMLLNSVRKCSCLFGWRGDTCNESMAFLLKK